MNVYVAFFSDASYASYLGVSIHSLKRRASRKHDYYLYILDAGIDWKHKQEILSMECENIHIEFKDITFIRDDLDVNSVAFRTEKMYLLWLDVFFPELKKILYLDSDTIILHDIAELYKKDFSGIILGAVSSQQKANSSHSSSIENYFDTGVMLINLCLYREKCIREKYFAMITKTPCLIQDALNIIFRGQVKYIDNMWNYQWSYHISLQKINGLNISEVMGRFLKEDEIYILHYNSGIKPWDYPEYDFAYIFWIEASLVPFYDEIILKSCRSLLGNVFSDYIFPWDEVPANSRVIIYGGGKVGKIFCRQIKETGYCKILAICDKHPERVVVASLPVITVDKLKILKNNVYDTIVIAIEKKDIAIQVKQELEEAGLSSIIWRDPCRH